MITHRCKDCRNFSSYSTGGGGDPKIVLQDRPKNTKNDNIFHIVNLIKVLRLLLWIGHCHLCMEGYFKLRLKTLKILWTNWFQWEIHVFSHKFSLWGEINEKYLIKKENKKKGSLKMQRLIFYQKLLWIRKI